MKRKKSLRSKLTRISKSKQKTAKPVYQMRIGIEAHIEYHQFLDDWGNDYQSILRTGIIDRQKGLSEEDLERTYQKRFDIQWAWADSLATNISQVYDQLKTAKENQLEMLREDIKSGEIKVKEKITQIESDLNNPTAKNSQNMDKRLLGLKSKIERLNRKKLKLERLKNTEKIHICWGSKKLFKAQHHLEENGYKSHQEWLCDWRKKRGGNFSSIGKGSVKGNNPMTPIHFMKDDIFSVTIKIPRCLQSKYGKSISLKFEVKGQRKHDLIYALEADKPVTVQIFRREHKNNQWYIHLSTYIQAIPTISSAKNGCIGIDLNAHSIDLVYVKSDGNLAVIDGKYMMESHAIPTGTSGQVIAKLRDIVVSIVKLAEQYQCPIAIENLDFAKKKASLPHQSKSYSRMLSGFIYDKFRACLMARAEKKGIQVLFENPFATSVIGMIKYMGKYGLNSAYAAAMVIARRGLGFSERIPRDYLELIGVVPPEDVPTRNWSLWGKICKLLRLHHFTRHQLFEKTKVCEVLQNAVSQSLSLNKRKRRRKVSSAST